MDFLHTGLIIYLLFICLFIYVFVYSFIYLFIYLFITMFKEVISQLINLNLVERHLLEITKRSIKNSAVFDPYSLYRFHLSTKQILTKIIDWGV